MFNDPEARYALYFKNREVLNIQRHHHVKGWSAVGSPENNCINVVMKKAEGSRGESSWKVTFIVETMEQVFSYMLHLAPIC